MSTDTIDSTPSNEPEYVQAQVIAAGVSYFDIEKVLGPDGKAKTDKNGNEMTITVRHDARLGEIITMTAFEFERNAALGAVRTPSDAPLLPAKRATPFGLPVVDETTGQAAAAVGPVMGDPRAAGPDVAHSELQAGRPEVLSLEAREFLEKVAAGEIDMNGNPIGPDDTPDHIASEAELEGADATRRKVEVVGDPSVTTGGAMIPDPKGNSLNQNEDEDDEDGEDDDNQVTAPDLGEEDVTAEQVTEYLNENSPNTEATLELAKDPATGEFDSFRAEKLLEAELSRPKDDIRQGVVEKLEKVVEDD